MYDSRIILLDADVVIHFIKGSELDTLPTIYDSQYWILDKVFNELYGLSYGVRVNRFISGHDNVSKVSLPMEYSVIKEYADLELRFGKGESAVMAMAKARGEVVASSNVNDVKDYCLENAINWVTTLDLLAEAYARGVLTGDRCNQFIQDVRNNESNLPNITITQYIKENL